MPGVSGVGGVHECDVMLVCFLAMIIHICLYMFKIQELVKVRSLPGGNAMTRMYVLEVNAVIYVVNLLCRCSRNLLIYAATSAWIEF